MVQVKNKYNQLWLTRVAHNSVTTDKTVALGFAITLEFKHSEIQLNLEILFWTLDTSIHSYIIHKALLQLEFYFNPKYILTCTLFKPLLGYQQERIYDSTIAVEYYQWWGTRSSLIGMADIKLDERYSSVHFERDRKELHAQYNIWTR